MQSKRIFNGDSWILPRQEWLDIGTSGKQGDRGTFLVSSDIGVYLRAKGELGEGVQISAYSGKEVQLTIGEDGKIQLFIASSPKYPAPRIDINIDLIDVKPIKKKKNKEEAEHKGVIEKFVPVIEEVLVDE